MPREKVSDIIGVTRAEYSEIENSVIDIFDEEGLTVEKALERTFKLISPKPLTPEQKKAFCAAFISGILITRSDFQKRAKDLLGALGNRIQMGG